MTDRQEATGRRVVARWSNDSDKQVRRVGRQRHCKRDRSKQARRQRAALDARRRTGAPVHPWAGHQGGEETR